MATGTDFHDTSTRMELLQGVTGSGDAGVEGVVRVGVDEERMWNGLVDADDEDVELDTEGDLGGTRRNGLFDVADEVRGRKGDGVGERGEDIGRTAGTASAGAISGANGPQMRGEWVDTHDISAFVAHGWDLL